MSRSHSVAMIAAAAVCAFFAACAVLTQASARDWTVRAEVGQTVNTEIDVGPLTLEPSNGSVVGIHLGTSVGPVNLEAGVRQIELEALAGAVTIDATNFTGTVSLDLPYGTFVGVGPDYYNTETTLGGVFSINDSGWGYHATAGVNFPINDRFAAQVAYRYTNSDDLGFTSGAVTASLSYTL